MPEFKKPGHWEPGHIIDGELLRRDLLYLLLLFYSSKPIANLGMQKLDFLNANIFETDVSRYLISTAVAIRISFDKAKKSFKSKEKYWEWIEGEEFICGTIKSIPFSKPAKPLYLREACNKIIHAEEINFDIQNRKGEYKGVDVAAYVMPFIHVYGSENKVPWYAKISIKDYVNSAVLE